MFELCLVTFTDKPLRASRRQRHAIPVQTEAGHAENRRGTVHQPVSYTHLVYPGFIGKTPPEALPSIERYLHADLLRLTKAKNDKNRDVRWAWEANEAKQLADKAVAKAQREPAGPRHETLMKQAETVRWMLEEFYVSLWRCV